jgi:hypothetical protein
MGDEPDDLVGFAARMFDAEAAAPIYVSVDGRTVDATHVRACARRFVEERLVRACDPLGLRSVEVRHDELVDAVFTWGSLVIDEARAAGLVDEVAAEGHAVVDGRSDGATLVKRAPSTRAGPAP